MPTEPPETFGPKQRALLHILKIASRRSAQLVMYASALGAIALIPQANLPTMLAGIATTVGFKLLGNIIDRVAQGEHISNEQVIESLQAAIADTRIDQLLSSNEFQRALGKLFRRLDLLGYAVEESEFTLSRQLAEQYGQHQTLVEELRDSLSSVSQRLDALATREQSDEALALLKRVVQLLEMQPFLPHEPAAPVAPSLHQLPSPPRDFTGRQAELDELAVALEKGGVTISGLRGMGGVGKTVLALKLAEQLTPCYPDAQFYLDLKGTSSSPLSPAEAMTHVVRAYYPTTKLPDDPAELHGLYCTVLHDQHALLLMDNARDRAQVEPLIPPPTCVLLVTSRWHFALPGLYAKDLDTLPPADARALLLKIAPRIGDQVDTIAQLCGHLPLALRLAGSAVAERQTLSVSDYVRRLGDSRQRLELVEASLTLSYELLKPELQREWCMLSVFPATFERLGAAVVWEMEPDAAQDALDELVRFSLVEWDEATGRYSLHDLLRLFAEAHVDERERAAAQRRHSEHYVQVMRAANTLYLQGGGQVQRGLALLDVEWANVQAGQVWATAHAATDDAAARLCSDYPCVGAYCLDLRLHSRHKIRWQGAALAAARKLKDRGAEVGHLGNLGLAYADLGDARRAIEFHEQALVIDREIGDRRGEGNTLGNLGLAYYALGDARRAIEFYEQALVIFREIGDRLGEGNALGGLGNAYADLGDARRAIEFYEQCLTIHREIGDRRGEANASWNLGLAYEKQGDLAQAVSAMQVCVEYERGLGHPDAEKDAAQIEELRARMKGQS